MRPVTFGFREVNRELMLDGVKNLRTSALLQIIMSVLSVVILSLFLASIPMIGMAGVPRDPARIIGALMGFMAIIVVGGILLLILGIAAFIYLYLGWSKVGEADKEFSLQKTAVKLLVIAIILIIIGFVAMMAMLFTAIVSASPGEVPTNMFGILGAALGGIAIIVIGGFIGLIAGILIYYGYYKLGEEYEVSELKIGGLALIISLVINAISFIPYLGAVASLVSLIGIILVFAGLSKLRGMLERGELPGYPAYQPPPPPPI